VTDGLVDLAGVIMSDGERQAVRVIAENIFGVVSVTDNMVFVDPGSGMAFG
jgi:osmotically-inducible protein OsmY